MHCNNNRWLIHLLHPRLMQRIFSEAEAACRDGRRHGTKAASA